MILNFPEIGLFIEPTEKQRLVQFDVFVDTFVQHVWGDRLHALATFYVHSGPHIKLSKKSREPLIDLVYTLNYQKSHASR